MNVDTIPKPGFFWRERNEASVPRAGSLLVLGTTLEAFMEISEMLIPVLPGEQQTEKPLRPLGRLVARATTGQAKPSMSNLTSALRDRSSP